MQPSSKPFEALEAVHVSTALLGGFAVSVNGAPIDSARWKFKHPRLLWQMLCLAPGYRLSRDEAAETLWPRVSAQASSNRLYHTLHALRGIFGGAGVSDARQLVRLQGGTLRLDEGVALELDVEHFRQAVHGARARHDSDAAMPFLETAQALLGGTVALLP
jgi:DNA-binding SARP family transcriptional activator